MLSPGHSAIVNAMHMAEAAKIPAATIEKPGRGRRGTRTQIAFEREGEGF